MLMSKEQIQKQLEKLSVELLAIRGVVGVTNNGKGIVVHISNKTKATEDRVFEFFEKNNDELPYALLLVGERSNLLKV